MMLAQSLTVLLGAVSTVFGQANTSFVNYSQEAQPNLTPQTVQLISLSFPDCINGPLATNLVCNSTADYKARAQALISVLTLEELISLSGNTAYGVSRLGVPAYQVWNEALHGLDRANMSDSGDFSSAPSSPLQARAFNNWGRYGLDSYAPNINGFRSPIWGRGQETPGEDASFLTAAYAYEYITGLQGGVNPEHLKIVATPKHFAGYDIENWDLESRLGNDLSISQQDLAGYYMPQFRVAIKDAKAQSLMCSYNAVNGVPSCANSFFLQTILRDEWGFNEYAGYVSTDCDAAYNVFNPHQYAANVSAAAAASIRAGADIDCGTSYQYYLNVSIAEGSISRDDIETAVTRLYSQLVRLGYFDGNGSIYRDLTWDDVVTTDSWNISYEAAVEGLVLLKNDGTLPLPSNLTSVALIGPWANASSQLQGNYFGVAPYLISPLIALEGTGLTVNYALGTEISSNSTANFSAAITAATNSDVIVFAGGIDNTVEAEGQDRMNLTWPGNQLDLIQQLSALGKPLIVLQMGGGQVDSSSLKNNSGVNALLWGGYPGQSGGQAIVDVLTGKRAPAGRLVTTQYPAEYALQFPQTDLNLRPDSSTGNPGQTYIWYTGEAVYPFGYGLFYTTFDTTTPTPNVTATADIGTIISAAHPDFQYIDQVPIINFTVSVLNSGSIASEYSAMLFSSTQNAGPPPYPNKWLVGFDRLASIAPGASSTLTIPVPLGAMARIDELGNSWLYPGTYELALNYDASAVISVTLTGNAIVLAKWPMDEQQIPPA